MLVKCAVQEDSVNNCFSIRTLQFKLTVVEQQVLRQLWNALLTQTNLLASEDFSVDDSLDLDVGPPGQLTHKNKFTKYVSLYMYGALGPTM